MLEREKAAFRASESALQRQREELSAARDAFDAKAADARAQLARQQEHLKLRLEQVRQREDEVQKEQLTIERVKEDCERRVTQAREREAGLVAQQSKLEAALTAIQDDRLAVENARSMADEVAQARSDELARSRAEVDSLRMEIMELRQTQAALQNSLDELRQAKAAVETVVEETRAQAAATDSARRAAIEEAKCEQEQNIQKSAAEVAEIRRELESLRGQRTKLENDLLNALEGRERLVEKLDQTRVELEQAGKQLERERAEAAAQIESLKVQKKHSANKQDLAPAEGPIVSAEIGVESHAGVGRFWTTLQSQESKPPSASPKNQAKEQPATIIENAQAPLAAPDNMATAMRAALAAAHAEVGENQVAANNHQQRSRSASKRAKTPPPAAPRKGNKTSQVPEQDTATVEGETKPAVRVAELDEETNRKLKTLRRLNPHKSDGELLAAIRAEGTQPEKPKPKRGWFALR